MLKTLKSKLQEKLNSDTHFSELIKGSGIAFVLRLFGIACGYVFTLLVTRTLGAKAWGIFALCLVVLQIASVLGRLGMDTALLRFTAEYMAKVEIGTLKDIYKKALTLIVPFSILIAVSVYFLSPILADKVFHKIYLTNYFRIISLVIVPFVLLWIHSESIRGLKKIKEYMLLQQSGIFFIAVLLFLIGFSFIKSHFLPIISYSISIIILTIISIYLWRKYLLYLLTINSSTTSTTSTTTSYKSLLSVSIPMLLSSSLALIMGWTDTIMLGMFKSAQEVGIYNVIYRISMVSSIILMSINSIIAPKISELWYKKKNKELAELIYSSVNLSFLCSFPVFICLVIFSRKILISFGDEFKNSIITFIIIVFGQFINSSRGIVGAVLQMTNKEVIFRNILFLAVILNILLNYLFIPRFGINGAALATIISLTFWNLMAILFIKIEFNIFIFYKLMLFPIKAINIIKIKKIIKAIKKLLKNIKI